MLPEPVKFRQLSFIKYLSSIGFEQAERPEPICYAALLTFHDSIELFLNLCSQHLDATIKTNQNFMDYWPAISAKLSAGTILTQQAGMMLLNKARVNFKHYGISPNKAEIDDFKVITKLFFEENTKSIFGIDFSCISLLDLVQCPGAKDDLKIAEKLLQEGKINESLEKIAFSWMKLFRDYENGVKAKFGQHPFAFSSPSISIRSISDDSSNFKEEVSGFSDDVVNSFGDIAKSLSEIQEAIEIISLGIDFRRYIKFNLIKPKIKKVNNWFYPEKFKENPWEYQIVKIDRGALGDPTSQDVQFCIDFVIECAIALQKLSI